MENRGIPGYWVILFERAMVHITLRRCASTSPSPYGDGTAAFRKPQPLGSSGTIYLSELQLPRPTRSRPYAFADPLPGPQQGLATDLLGYALAGWDLHPLDDN